MFTSSSTTLSVYHLVLGRWRADGFWSFFMKSSCLPQLEMVLMRAGHKTLSSKMLKSCRELQSVVITICGFITSSVHIVVVIWSIVNITILIIAGLICNILNINISTIKYVNISLKNKFLKVKSPKKVKLPLSLLISALYLGSCSVPLAFPQWRALWLTQSRLYFSWMCK